MTLAQESISGLFRGICVDNQDPTGVGRIRVQVPQVLGEAASGWAFPAWSQHDLTIWPEDRLPKVGDGVWVMFEAASPDKMIWVAAFGPLDLINQPPYTQTFEYETTTTMTTPALDWNASVVFTGTLSSAGGGVPNPNPIIQLWAEPAGEAARIVAWTQDIDPITGNWAIPYVVNIPGFVTYKAVFPGIAGGAFAPSSSTDSITDTATTTSVTTPSFPTLYHGTGFTVSGTVNAASGERVSAGYVQLWYRLLNGGDTSWKQATTAGSPPVADGNYTLTNGALGHVGPTEWQVRYFGGGQFLDSVSAVVRKDPGLRPGPTPTKGSIGHTSLTFSYSAVSGAQGYDIQRSTGSGFSAWITNTTTRSISNNGLSHVTNYYYRVRPRAQDAGGNWIYGSYGPYIRGNTGRPEQRDSGTSGWIYKNPNGQNSHRKDVGWYTAGYSYQGYYSSPYGGDGYIGIIDHGNNGIRDRIRSALSTARQQNGSCAAFEIELTKRGNVGTGGKVTISFYTSDSADGSGGRPNREGSAVNRTSTNGGGTSWYNLGTAHGNRLGNGNSRSVAIYRNDRTNYAAFDGGRIRIKWTWNYVTVSRIAPKWY